MKLTIKTALLAAMLLLGVQQARASIHLDLDFEDLYGANTSTLAPANGTLVLLASTLDSSFGNLTLATTSFTDPSQTDDQILARWQMSLDGAFRGALDFNLTGNLTAGDPLQLVWYPNLTFSTGLTGPGDGQIFGTFRSDTATAYSDIGWNVPADGDSVNLVVITVLAGGDIADSSMVANLQTVPEPSSLALVALGCISALALRRRMIVRG